MDVNLDREVTVEQKSETIDATYGTKVVTWIPLDPMPGSPVIGYRWPAEVRDALPSRSEGVVQGLKVARNQTRVRLRYRSDIDASMRITIHGDEDRVMQIVGGPAEIGPRKSFIEIVCERVSSDPE